MNSDISLILISIISLSVIGGLSGMILAFAAEKFKVEVDPKIKELLGLLPGVNCGACGYPSCEGFAQALASGKAKHDGCKVGGISTADKIAEKLGAAKH
jgi:Na+-translocating ferredoxin:NAD+ oxidoreductase subunit B